MHTRLLFCRAALFGAAFYNLAAAEEPKDAMRLDAVTWNPIEHTLTWSISKGTVDSRGDFKSSDQKIAYEIDMDAAIMAVKGERRAFSKMEAVSVRRLMDLVARYAAESTVWWDEGQGQPLDRDRVRAGDPTLPVKIRRLPANTTTVARIGVPKSGTK